MFLRFREYKNKSESKKYIKEQKDHDQLFCYCKHKDLLYIFWYSPISYINQNNRIHEKLFCLYT